MPTTLFLTVSTNREVLSVAGVAGEDVSEVVLGQVLAAAQGQNPARQVIFLIFYENKFSLDCTTPQNDKKRFFVREGGIMSEIHSFF